MNGNPTEVVWALGSSFNKEAEVDEQLKALNQVLSENDAFITYQMTDTQVLLSKIMQQSLFLQEKQMKFRQHMLIQREAIMRGYAE